MTLNPDRLSVPEEYFTDLFRLRRQKIEDNASDFDAVMQSREELRVWSDSDWPGDTFTLAENLSDLAMHISEHERDEAYGFSIFRGADDTLIGSLYLNPIDSITAAYDVGEHVRPVVQSIDVCADYWLREGLGDDLQVAFARTVKQWLSDAWWFKRVAFGSRRNMLLQRSHYVEAGMTEVAVLRSTSGTRQFHLHAP